MFGASDRHADLQEGQFHAKGVMQYDKGVFQVTPGHMACVHRLKVGDRVHFRSINFQLIQSLRLGFQCLYSELAACPSYW